MQYYLDLGKQIAFGIYDNWAIISVFIMGVVATFKAKSVSRFVAAVVTSAEMAFEKHQSDEKFVYAMSKIEAKYPIITTILGSKWTTRMIESTLKQLQELIGTTGERLENQTKLLEVIKKENIISAVKNLTAKFIGEKIREREFYGDYNLVSNQQVTEEVEKVIANKDLDSFVETSVSSILKNINLTFSKKK